MTNGISKGGGGSLPNFQNLCKNLISQYLEQFLNPICAVFFYPHFSCVRASDLKFYDFLNNIKTNFLKLFFVKKFIFAATGLWQKMVKKRLVAFQSKKFKKKHIFSTFFPFNYKNIVYTFLKKFKKFQKCPQNQVYLSQGSWYQVVQQTLNLSTQWSMAGHFLKK